MANILIVDDSAAARKNLKAILNAGGHDVVSEATNGLQAYSEYKTYQPDLVTMDITMPRVDGVEAIAMIISNFPEAKIVVMSSIAHKNTVLRAMEKGAKHYIIKPLNPEKVLGVIEQVLLGR